MLNPQTIEILLAPSILACLQPAWNCWAKRCWITALPKASGVTLPVTEVPTLNHLYSPDRDEDTNCLNTQALQDFSAVLRKAVTHSLDQRRFPLVLGGDCSILLGIMPALKKKGRYGLVFVDAHADFYEPEKSTTGEVADMDLADRHRPRAGSPDKHGPVGAPGAVRDADERGRGRTGEGQIPRVTATGTYDAAHELLVRRRTQNSQVGFYVLTPLKTPGGTVLINWGWVSRRDRRHPPRRPPAPGGQVTLTGRLRPAETTETTGIIDRQGLPGEPDPPDRRLLPRRPGGRSPLRRLRRSHRTATDFRKTPPNPCLPRSAAVVAEGSIWPTRAAVAVHRGGDPRLDPSHPPSLRSAAKPPIMVGRMRRPATP